MQGAKLFFMFALELGNNKNLKLPTQNASVTLSQASDMKYAIMFLPRKGKMKADTGKCPLYLRITVGNCRSEVSCGKWIVPSKWNPKSQRLVGNSPEANAINGFIKEVGVKLHNIHTSLLRNGELITSEVLKAHLLGKTEKQKTVLEAFDSHLKYNANAYSVATAKKYGYCRNHLKNFMYKTYSATDIFLSRVNHSFIKDFQWYLANESQFLDDVGKMVYKDANEHNSTLKYLKMFKTVISGAIAHQWIDTNPFALFKEKFKTVEQEFLDESELNKIIALNISIDRLSLVRDLFVFSCFTGLAYVDLKKLSKEDLFPGIDKKKWIKISRTKTNTTCRIPLLGVAEDIARKYSTHPECVNSGRLLPVCSNQKLNAYLKEIADLAGIKKNLTCHVARRTFATMATESGVPGETIIKMIGHSDYKHLHLYAKVGDKKLAEDMNLLQAKFG